MTLRKLRKIARSDIAYISFVNNTRRNVPGFDQVPDPLRGIRIVFVIPSRHLDELVRVVIVQAVDEILFNKRRGRVPPVFQLDDPRPCVLQREAGQC